MSKKFDKFIQDQHHKFPGRDVEGEILQPIVEADRHPSSGRFIRESTGVKLSDAHMHNATNYTLSGTIEWEGVTYGFIVCDGNNNGTEVIQWGLEEDIPAYEPEPAIVYTLIPKSLDLTSALGYQIFRDVYLPWRNESWFSKLVSDYNYDRTFSPTLRTSAYYKAQADKKGLQWAHPEEFNRVHKRFEELHTMSQPQRAQHFQQ